MHPVQYSQHISVACCDDHKYLLSLVLKIDFWGMYLFHLINCLAQKDLVCDLPIANFLPIHNGSVQ